MFEYKVLVNDRNYEFVYKDGTIHLLRNDNGNFSLVNINLIKTDDKTVLLNHAVEAMLSVIRSNIEQKLERGEYKNTEDIQKDIETMVGSIDIPEITRYFDKDSVLNSSKIQELYLDMNKKFSKVNEDLTKKEEIVKENIDVQLSTLFKENNITEYNINTNASVVVFYKNGIPHTINNSNGNRSIYETILSEIEIDKISSREDVDKAISKAIDLDSQFKFSENRVIDVNALENPSLGVATNISNDYTPSNMYGVLMDSGISNDQMILADFGNGLTPVNVAANPSGNNMVTLGDEKTIDNSGDVMTGGNTVDSINKEESLNDEGLDRKISDLLVKCLNNEELTNDEKQFAESYRNSELFYKLSIESQNNMVQIHKHLDDLKEEYDKENGIEKENPNVKTLGEMPTDGKKETDLSTFIIILAGVLTGLLSLLFNTAL